MFTDELLFELNEHELADIAKRINISTTIGVPAKKKSKHELAYDIYSHINSMAESDKKDAIREITTTGRMIFTAFRTTKMNASADYKIPKDYIEYQDKINNLRIFLPEKINEMISGYSIVMPNGTNHVFIIKKDFGGDIGFAGATQILRNVCQGMQTEQLFKSDIVKNVYSKVATKKLNTTTKLTKAKTKKFRVFYDQHKCDGEFLTISTKIASSRSRIGKVITRLASIDQTDVDSLVKSKKINSLASTPDIINYSIINTPQCVRDTLVNIIVNVLMDNAKGTSSPIRYKLSIHQQEIKVLTVDTNFNDIKAIVDIILEIH